MHFSPLRWSRSLLPVLVRVRRRLVVVLNPQAAAQVQVADLDAQVPQPLDQLLQSLQGVHEGRHLGDLGADVAGHPHHLEMRQVPGPAIVLQGLLDVDAELVLLEPRGDVGMGPGIDVRIDPQGHPGLDLQAPGEAVDLLQFLGGLQVEQQDVRLEGRLDLLGLFAHPGIDDLARVHPGRQGPVEFAAGDDVGPGPQPGEEPQNRQVGVGFHREAEDMGKVGERGVEDPVVMGQGAGAVEIKRRAHLLGDLLHRHVFAVKFTCLVMEVMH